MELQQHQKTVQQQQRLHRVDGPLYTGRRNLYIYVQHISYSIYALFSVCSKHLQQKGKNKVNTIHLIITSERSELSSF